MMRPGPRNLVTDVAGLRVGNAADARLKSGVTVLTADVPFVAAEITAFKPDRKPIEKFNEILHAEGKLVPKYTCVKTQDLKDKGDQLHYDTASARELGRRYAAAMQDLQK